MNNANVFTLKKLIGMIVLVVGVIFFSACDKEQKCVAKPKKDCACTQDFTPVCGCDGLTYNNACEAACARVDVQYTGVCQ